MTTIAFDGKTLAADRKITDGGAVHRHGPKIHAVPGGHVALAGNMDAIQKYVTWLRNGARGAPPAGSDEMGGILVCNGCVYCVENGIRMEVASDTKMANGCGWHWAAAAMDFGCTAVEAVAYAATRDTLTGGGVDAVTITQPRRKPARKG